MPLFRVIEDPITHQYYVEKLIRGGRPFIWFGPSQLVWELVLEDLSPTELPPAPVKKSLFPFTPPVLRKRKRVFDTLQQAITYINELERQPH